MKTKKIYKYDIDDWVIYKPFDFSQPKRAVILWVYDDDRQMYDYEIYIDGEGKYIKVLQSSLFPVDTPTY
jgi:hypothetical protein|tara:strand:- start:163 stop:372 length:210 start_codon:yes stop_codon:yes gene_type:complete